MKLWIGAMWLPSEDLIGRIALTVIFFLFSLVALARIVALLAEPEPSSEQWALDLITRAVSYVFMMLVVFTTVTRLPARATAMGLEPRLSAVLGTFSILTLVVLPSGEIGTTAKFVASVLVLAGTALSVYCLAWLGRSFSVMAHARHLVTDGPYGIIRHPLYGAEMVTLAGLAIANYSLAALGVIALTVVFQIRRMFNEEKILRAAFPEYADYARRVPMLIPMAIRANRPDWYQK